MTDIATMPAGPELDRLVAEKRMGWKGVEHAGQITVYDSGRIVRPTRWDCRDWSPSTDIAHAWEVVEKMRAGRWTLHLEEEPPYPQSQPWRASFCNVNPDDGRASCMYADTAPLAICRAAIAALD